MSEWREVKESQVRNEDVQSRIRVDFIKLKTGYLQHEPYKTILTNMSSGCTGCRIGAYGRALKILKEND